jgi:hypothetical protein
MLSGNGGETFAKRWLFLAPQACRGEAFGEDWSRS